MSWAGSGPRARSGPRSPSVRPATLLGNNMATRPAKPQPKNAGFMNEITRRPYTRSTASFTKRLCAPSLPASLTSCLLWWRSSTPSSPAAWITASSRHWLTRSTCDLLYFCKVRWQSRGAMHAVPFMRSAEGDRHLSSSEVSSLRWSVLRPAMARSTSPADGHHYAPERPQREAAGQRHPRNKQARTHHRLRDKAAIVGGAAGCCSCTDGVEPDTCVSVVASLNEEFASRFAGVRPLASSCLPPPLTFPWTTPLPPADGVSEATVQCWTEGEVLQLFSTVFFRNIALPSRNFPKYIAHV